MNDFKRLLPLREPVHGEHDERAVLEQILETDRLPILLLHSSFVFFVVEKSTTPDCFVRSLNHEDHE